MCSIVAAKGSLCDHGIHGTSIEHNSNGFLLLLDSISARFNINWAEQHLDLELFAYSSYLTFIFLRGQQLWYLD